MKVSFRVEGETADELWSAAHKRVKEFVGSHDYMLNVTNVHSLISDDGWNSFTIWRGEVDVEVRMGVSWSKVADN